MKWIKKFRLKLLGTLFLSSVEFTVAPLINLYEKSVFLKSVFLKSVFLKSFLSNLIQ